MEKEEKRLEMEKEEKRLEMEKQKEEKILEKEKEERRLAMEKEERRLEMELKNQQEMRKLELESERLRYEQERHTMSTTKSVGKPKLPYFNDKVDNIESYLYKFELHAEAMAWPKDTWASNIAILLQGKALDYFREMPREQIRDYDRVKQNLLRRFVYTEDSFREKFRSARCEKTEDTEAFAVRLSSYFHRWIEMAECEGSLEKMTDLMLRDQFYNAVHKDVVAFLKERKPASLEEMVKLTDQFRAAHPHKPVAKPIIGSEFTAVAMNEDTTNRGRPQFRSDNYRRSFKPGGSNVNNPRSSSYYKNDFRYRNDNFKKEQRDQHHNNKPWKRQNSRDGNDRKYSNSRERQTMVCFKCNLPGHKARFCKNQASANAACEILKPKCSKEDCLECQKVNKPGNELRLSCGHTLPVLAARLSDGNLKLHQGLVNRKQVTVLRDSGCTTVGVNKNLVSQSDYLARRVNCILFTGSAVSLPVAKIFIDTPFYTGEVEACVLDAPVADLIIGNISGVENPTEDKIDMWYRCKDIQIAAVVQTRSNSKMQQFRALSTHPINLDFSKEDLIHMQRQDESLKSCFVKANRGEFVSHAKAKSHFYFKDGLLYRQYQGKDIVQQLVVPDKLIPTILKLAHDSPMSGHMGVARTKQRVTKHFYWPKVFTDVKLYCRSCDCCQKTTYKNKTCKAPVQSVPAMSTPFDKVSVDIIGPIEPCTDRGHRYILTLIDNATRWPEASPLKNIRAETVAEELFNIFTRLGIPNKILSDNGTQFISSVMSELFRLLSIDHAKSSPYHAQSNGMVERLNGTLKQILKRVASDRPKDWDRFLPAVLFSYREVRQESTGFSPFELLFGHRPRGPMTLLHDILTEEQTDSSTITTFEYISNIKDRLRSACELGKQASDRASEKSKHWKNNKAKLRELKPNDEVLLLLPNNNNKLLMTWKGPYKVIRRTSVVDYIINIDGKEKLYHINMLKQYFQRPERLREENNPIGQINIAAVGLVSECDQELVEEKDHVSLDIQTPVIQRKQTYKDVLVNPELSHIEKEHINELLRTYDDVLSDVPGRTDVIKHKIKLTSDVPIKQKPYPIPFKSKDIVEDEIKSLLEQGIIEPSNSPYSSPIVLVKKKDGTIRFAIDFRKLNAITVFDATPIPNQEELLLQITNSKIFSKLDLTKGYWQIPMDEESREFTAFQTPLGLFQWKFMPFGLVNAPATFAYMMRVLLRDIPGVISFFDDILINTETFEEHLYVLKTVLQKLRQCGLTAKPSKVAVAHTEIEFLGHIVSHGEIKPEDGKISKILSLSIPKTKKEIRSLLGVLSYYRKFVPNFAAISAPLSSLTRKGLPDKVQWTDECADAFKKIQFILSHKPVLILPDFNIPFVLRTDASDHGIGGCLLQERDGVLHPIMYASRKLLDREIKYSVIERECLSILWSVSKFRRYLEGTRFVIESDHRPLKFLEENRSTCSRLARWSLMLQNFKFHLRYIPGPHNYYADVLSRLV